MSDPPKRQDRVLIVDDTPETLSFLTDALENAGLMVLVATDGTSALALLDLPPRHVAIDEQVPLLDKKGCACADDEHSARCLLQAASLFREFALVQEFYEFVFAHEGKHRIIA